MEKGFKIIGFPGIDRSAGNGFKVDFIDEQFEVSKRSV